MNKSIFLDYYKICSFNFEVFNLFEKNLKLKVDI